MSVDLYRIVLGISFFQLPVENLRHLFSYTTLFKVNRQVQEPAANANQLFAGKYGLNEKVVLLPLGVLLSGWITASSLT